MTHSHQPTEEDQRISAAVRGLLGQRKTPPAEVWSTLGVSKTAFYNKLKNASPWLASEVSGLAVFFGVSRDSLYEGRVDYAPADAGCHPVGRAVPALITRSRKASNGGFAGSTRRRSSRSVISCAA